MNIEDASTIEQTEIRSLVNERLKALRAKDVTKLITGYLPGVLSYDVIGPLEYNGSAAMKNRLEEWFATFLGPIGFDISELCIAAGLDVAFQYCLNHVSATKTDGSKLDMWWRETIGYKKINGEWIITHQHSSVPFDVTSGKASVGLQP